MKGQSLGQSALAAGSRAIDGDNHASPTLASAAPQPFMLAAKPGKLVLIVMQPVTVIGSADTMPSVRKDIAIRWSCCESMLMPPATGLPVTLMLSSS